MKVSKRRKTRWKTMRPFIEIEVGQSANPMYIQALRFCLSIMDGESPELKIQDVRAYLIEIEERINHFIYDTSDILKTNALMECTDIIREYAENLHIDYRLEERKET